MKREFLGSCLVATMLAAGPTAVWAQGNGNGNGPARPFSFAAIGDVPYTPITGTGNNSHQVYPVVVNGVDIYDKLINSINSNDVAYTVHIGDIKGGNTWCDDAVYTNNVDYFNKFANPLIFSPGDNEWTDCHRATNGGMNPIERLSLLRTLFFSSNKSLGQKTTPLIKDKAPYVENSSWEEKPVMFIALHQPGSNNNFQRRTSLFQDATDAEFTARNASNMEFLEDRLKKAKLDPQVKLVVIASQANPFDRYLEPKSGSNPDTYTQSGYADFITKIRAFVTENPDKHVLYVHGDTHTFRVSQPLTDIYPSLTQLTPAGKTLTNFTRLEVYAQDAAFTNWVKVSVSPDGSFSTKVIKP